MHFNGPGDFGSISCILDFTNTARSLTIQIQVLPTTQTTLDSSQFKIKQQYRKYNMRYTSSASVTTDADLCYIYRNASRKRNLIYPTSRPGQQNSYIFKSFQNTIRMGAMQIFGDLVPQSRCRHREGMLLKSMFNQGDPECINPPAINRWAEIMGRYTMCQIALIAPAKILATRAAHKPVAGHGHTKTWVNQGQLPHNCFKQ